MNRDGQLLFGYAHEGSQRAFEELVSRHIDAVYASARRQVRDSGLAEDITQAVFLMLASKAKSLRADVLLSAWLMTATWYACRNALRRERRRKIHEARAATMMPATVGTDVGAALDVEPVLDRALQSLKEADRAAVVMHYLQGRDFEEVAAALQTTAEGARKRVERAVAKLRTKFAQAGVEIAPAAMAPFLHDAATIRAPAELAKKVGAAATTGAAAVIAAAAVAAMNATKAKLAALAIGSVMAVGGIAVLIPLLVGGGAPSRTHGQRIMSIAEANAPRDVLIKLAEAVRAGDDVEARKCVDVSDPAYVDFIDEGAESIRLTARFKRTFRARFGDEAADALPEFIRPEWVPADAAVTFTASDRAIVAVPKPNAPTTSQMALGATWDTPMVKVGGEWKVQLQSIQWWNQGIRLTPKLATELARMNNDVCRRAIEQMEAGAFEKPEEARKFFGDGVRASLLTVVTKMQASTQPASTRPLTRNTTN
jgi:RNA polymerase sigma factor (sigma-70 family)